MGRFSLSDPRVVTWGSPAETWLEYREGDRVPCPGAREAVATQSGSHLSVWKCLSRSGNPHWRHAGHRGIDLLEFRRKADYEDIVPSLISTTKQAVEMAEEILVLLR